MPSDRNSIRSLEDDIEKVFEHFEQTEIGSEAEGGSGLGLPISREFARMLGGEIAAKSQVGVGSTFRFDILVEEGDVEDKVQGGPERTVVGLVPGQDECRILVVDDIEANRRLLSTILEPIGFVIREAANGKEAVEAFHTWDPQLVLMDVSMPVMDGFEATRQIRSSAHGTKISIIAVTASAFEEDREKVLASGMSDFLRKPFRDRELLDLIYQHTGVAYTYAEEAGAGLRSTLTPAEREPSIESLDSLPSDLVAQMKEATLNGYMSRLSELLDEVEEIDGQVASGLRSLADRFEYDELTRILEGGTAWQ